MDAVWLREQFPVFEQRAYLNSGTCGPLATPELRSGADSALLAATEGRSTAYFAALVAHRAEVRALYAAAIGARAEDVALTTATSDGIVRVLAGLRLQAGDEVLTAEDEHPGLLGPLAMARRALGVDVRTVPLARIHEAVDPARTKLVACSHVSWVTGTLAPPQLAEVGREIPVLLDGAQGAGAIAVDVEALGCAAYAAAGQKWLCGPIGTGLLHIAPAWRERITPLGPTYVNLSEPGAGLDAEPWPDARAHDAPALSDQVLAAAAAAATVLADAGWPAVFERAAGLADRFADALTAAGRIVAPRGPTTLVAFEDADPRATVARLAEAGVIVRALPDTPYVRASVGAFNDDSDLERLLAAL